MNTIIIIAIVIINLVLLYESIFGKPTSITVPREPETETEKEKTLRKKVKPGEELKRDSLKMKGDAYEKFIGKKA